MHSQGLMEKSWLLRLSKQIQILLCCKYMNVVLALYEKLLFGQRQTFVNSILSLIPYV